MKVLVTGGSSGLGAAVVDAVGTKGDTAFVLDQSPPKADVPHLVVDLSDRSAAERSVRDAAAELGGLDAVVTCAGVDACGALVDVPGDQWDRVVSVNLLGCAAVVRAALPALVESGGRVVTVASTLGLRALPDATAYCASKFGVVGFTRALALEMKGRIGVTLLIPGGMRTPFFDGRDPRYQPPADAPLNRPEDVAGAVMFALGQPAGCEAREIVMTPSVESSWP